MRIVLVLVLVLVLGGVARADEPAFTVGFAPSMRYARLDGFLQIPRGGEPGTASTSRPTLDEIGISDALTAGLRADARYDRHELLLDAWLLDADGSATVRDPFVSRTTTYGPDERVRSSLGLTTLRLAYGYAFPIDLGDAGHVTITPYVGAGLLDFSMRLRGERAGTTKRDFRHGLWQVGLGAEWAPGDRFSLTLTALGNPPLRPTDGVFTADLLARVRILGEAADANLSVFAGPGVAFFEIEDGQTFPNHVRMLAGPVVIAGIEVRF